MFTKQLVNFVTMEQIGHFAHIDNSAARQIANKRGCGKIRHMDQKLLWLQMRKDMEFLHISTDFNIANLLAKPLGGARMKSLMYFVGFLNEETGDPVGLREKEELENKKLLGKNVKQLAQTILKIAMLEGLGQVNGYEMEPNANMSSAVLAAQEEKHFVSLQFALMVLMMVVLATLIGGMWWFFVKKYKPLCDVTGGPCVALKLQVKKNDELE